MGLITSVLAEIEYRNMKHVAKLNKKAQEKAIKQSNPSLMAPSELAKWKLENRDKSIVDGMIVDRSIARPSSPVQTNYPNTKRVCHSIQKTYKQALSLKSKFAKLKINDQTLNDLVKQLEIAASYSNPAKISKFNINEFGTIKNSLEALKQIKTKKEYKEYLKENSNKFAEKQRAIRSINNASRKLDKQKAELNSGKNVANNDPQKAEKLAKIAKLQRELDELKGEVSEDFEPEIVDKNN